MVGTTVKQFMRSIILFPLDRFSFHNTTKLVNLAP